MAKGMTKATLGGKLLHPTEYVAAVEFQGRDVTLTIASVKLDELQIQGGKKEQKPILCFKETRKKLVLNKTNAGTIADMYGIRAEDWAGKKITLYPTTTTCGRDRVDCVRVRDRVPGASAPPPPQEIIDATDATETDAVFGDQPDGKSIGDANAAPPADMPLAGGDA